MREIMKDARKWAVAWAAFLCTVFMGGSLFAAVGSTWTNPDGLEKSSWGNLAAAEWNQLLGNFKNLESRVSAIDSTLAWLAVIPKGTVIAYNGTTCPAWWTEAAGSSVPFATGGSATLNLRGEFVRGWNRTTAGADANRTFWSWQDMDWKWFYQTDTGQAWSSGYSHNDVYMGKSTTAYVWNLFTGQWNNPSAAIGTKWDTSEIRPRNVALLYCVKN